MNLAPIILASITLLVQKYADYDEQVDLQKTLAKLRDELSFPRIATFDFIVGE